MVKAPEGNPYNSLSHTVACRITGCLARINDPVLHERLFHWGKPVCECQACVLARKAVAGPENQGKQEKREEKHAEGQEAVVPSLSLSDWA